jgi:hypothetical protein
MGLRATPHLADEPARVYRHTILGKSKSSLEREILKRRSGGASIDARRDETRRRR